MEMTGSREGVALKSAVLAAGVLALWTLLGDRIDVYMRMATVTYALMVLGYSYRRTFVPLHAALMSAAVVADLVLLLAVEMKRGAIKTAVGLTLDFWQQAHVVSSSMAVLLYVPTIALGVSAYRSRSRGLPRRGTPGIHKRLGTAVMVFKTLGFVLMFTMVSRLKG